MLLVLTVYQKYYTVSNEATKVQNLKGSWFLPSFMITSSPTLKIPFSSILI